MYISFLFSFHFPIISFFLTITFFFFLLELLLGGKCYVLNRSPNSLTFISALPFGLQSGRWPELCLVRLLLIFHSVTFFNPRSCSLFSGCCFVSFSVPISRLCILVLTSAVVAFLQCQERFPNTSEALTS